MTMKEFIQKIRSCPMLWDVNNLLFRDTAQKNANWDHIAAVCGMTNGLEAKIVWSKLRCSYREAMRRRSVDKGLPAWKYEGLMRFLTQSPQTDAVFDTSTYQTEEKCETDDDDDAIVKLEKVDTASPERDVAVSFYKVDSSNDSRFKEQMRELGRDGNATNIHSPPARLREQLRDEREQQRRESRRSEHDWSRVDDLERGGDALTSLFASLCQKTRQLPKYLQLVVQREIFEVVIRAEEEALANERAPIQPN